MIGLREILDILLFALPCVIIALIVWRTNPIHSLFGATFIDFTCQLLRSITEHGTAQIPPHQMAGCVAAGLLAFLATSIMRRKRRLAR